MNADSVTPNYFSLLGVPVLLGQPSLDTVAGRPQVVLGYRRWQRLGGVRRRGPAAAVA